MSEVKWNDDNTITVDAPKRPKKCTGTRFGAVLGTNRWSSSFEAWCAITRTYEKPFEDTIYTIAGKTIEPKQAEYMKNSYGMRILTPTDKFGENYFQKTYGDFFKENKIFGGMWDFLQLDEEGKPVAVLEMKTTKRAEDWSNDIPEYYALQGALYAYLLGLEDVIMVASFLDEKDYEHPEMFVPRYDNTITVSFKLHERYPNFEKMVATVEQWWNDHVVTGISPVFDEKKDAEILQALRKNDISTEDDVKKMILEAESLKADIDSAENAIAEKTKRYKEITDSLKKFMQSQFRDGDKKVSCQGDHYMFEVSKSKTSTVDKNALKADGLLDKYLVSNETYRLTVKEY